MGELQEDSKFLKFILGCENSAASHDIRQRIQQVQKDIHCVWRMFFMMGLVALLAMAGLCYWALFVPGSLRYHPPVGIKLLSALGLGALFCLVISLAHWLWFRGRLRGLNMEARRFVAGMLVHRPFANGSTKRVWRSSESTASRPLQKKRAGEGEGVRVS
jgi:hypothetical protein